MSSGRFALAFLLAASACGGGEPKPVQQAVCDVVPPTECPDPAPNYADVAPIFQQRCASCHFDAPGAPWPLDTYSHVADWAVVVRDELVRCAMPPADSGITLPVSERDRILNWVRCGYPE